MPKKNPIEKPGADDARPEDAVDCKKCGGERRRNQICGACGNKGWLTPAELAAFKARKGGAGEEG